MSLSKSCIINISGSHQDIESRTYINKRIRPLFNRVPTNSSFHVSISEVDNLVEGNLVIRSSCICFMSTKRAENIYDVVELIIEEIILQINLWIEKRVI